jgi:hypothetical protein
MDHNNRISKLEQSSITLAFLDDQAVIRGIRSGFVDDRHLAWVDPLLRPSIQVQLAAFAFCLRMGVDSTDGEVGVRDTPTCIGARVLATPGDEPLSDELEYHLANGLFYVDLPDPFLAAMALGADGRRKDFGQAWLQRRLVGKALGPDLGQSLRALLDQSVALGRPLGSAFDLRKPHAATWNRIAAFVGAFDLPTGIALVPTDDQWPLLEQLTTATFAE